jgi:hypothetical protein
MNTLINLWFNSGWVNWFLIMLTIFILWILILGSIRIIIETSIPKAFTECAKIYLSIVKAAEVAKAKLLKEQDGNN